MINYILFDVDNTLYRASWGLDRVFNQAITQFVVDYLSITTNEAKALRKVKSPQYGTTLEWLRQEKGLKDIEAFFEAVHPDDVSPYLRKNSALPKMLKKLPQKKAILTNAPHEHARRILQFLGIEDCFTGLYDIRYHEMKGKPNKETYRTTLSEAGFEIRETLFIDDHPKYLYPFKQMGGQVLLIDEYRSHKDKPDLPYIESILDLEHYLIKKS